MRYELNEKEKLTLYLDGELNSFNAEGVEKDYETLREKIRLVCYTHMVWWAHTNQPDNKVRLEGNRDRLFKLLDKYDDMNFENKNNQKVVFLYYFCSIYFPNVFN